MISRQLDTMALSIQELDAPLLIESILEYSWCYLYILDMSLVFMCMGTTLLVG